MLRLRHHSWRVSVGVLLNFRVDNYFSQLYDLLSWLNQLAKVLTIKVNLCIAARLANPIQLLLIHNDLHLHPRLSLIIFAVIYAT
jgi:hypothetical protein